MSHLTNGLKSLDPTDLLPRYVWLDEEGDQVSPIHTNLNSALDFIRGWTQKMERTERGERRLGYGQTPLTKSGQPPHVLKRVMVSINVVDLAGDEQIVADAMVRIDREYAESVRRVTEEDES